MRLAHHRGDHCNRLRHSSDPRRASSAAGWGDARGVRGLARPVRRVDPRGAVRARVAASQRRGGLAAAPSRRMGLARRGLVLDHRRAMGLGDAPLRTLGLRSGAGLAMGAGVRVGGRPGSPGALRTASWAGRRSTRGSRSGGSRPIRWSRSTGSSCQGGASSASASTSWRCPPRASDPWSALADLRRRLSPAGPPRRCRSAASVAARGAARRTTGDSGPHRGGAQPCGRPAGSGARHRLGVPSGAGAGAAAPRGARRGAEAGTGSAPAQEALPASRSRGADEASPRSQERG